MPGLVLASQPHLRKPRSAARAGVQWLRLSVVAGLGLRRRVEYTGCRLQTQCFGQSGSCVYIHIHATLTIPSLGMWLWPCWCASLCSCRWPRGLRFLDVSSEVSLADVPFAVSKHLAVVSALVGAGGNLGAVIAGFCFYKPIQDTWKNCRPGFGEGISRFVDLAYCARMP